MEMGEGRTEERQAIAARLALKSLEDWSAEFRIAEIPFSPLMSLGEALETDHAVGSRVMAQTTVDGEPVLVPNVPIWISDGSAEELPEHVNPAPSLGEHTDEFLRQIRAH